MKSILFFVFISLTISLSGQKPIKHDTTYNKFMLGIYPSFSYSEQLIDDNSEEKANIFILDIRPYFAYNLYKNLYLGCNFSYEFFASNFYEKENFIEAGVFMRYIIPYTLDKRFLKRFHFYTEFGYSKTNYRIVSDILRTVEYKTVKIEEDFIISKSLNQSKFSLPIGFTFHASSKFFIDLNWQYIHFINGTNINGFMCGIGYNMGTKQ
jgi:opacity protein-like surface antigen